MSTVVLDARGSHGRLANAHSTVAQPATRRLRLTRRGRVVVGILLTIAISVVVLVAGLWGVSAVASSDAPRDFSYVTVYSGDSLWSIATRVAPDVDPRDAISEIMQLNGLSDANVTPGQQIAIPLDF